MEDLSSKQQTQPWPQMPPLALGADTSRDVSGAGIKPEMGTSPGWDRSQHSRTPTQKYAAITLFFDPASLHLVETNKKPHHRKPQTAFPASTLPKRRSVLRLPPACYCFTRCLLTPCLSQGTRCSEPITISLQSACRNRPRLLSAMALPPRAAFQCVCHKVKGD